MGVRTTERTVEPPGSRARTSCNRPSDSSATAALPKSSYTKRRRIQKSPKPRLERLIAMYVHESGATDWVWYEITSNPLERLKLAACLRKQSQHRMTFEAESQVLPTE